MAVQPEARGLTPEAPEVSVVVPVLNEKDNLRPLADEIRDALDAAGLVHEILLVNDGSTDGSAEVIADLARSRPGVRGIHFRERRGQTAALDAGFKAARGRVVVTLDADLQNDPHDIPSLLGALRDADAAVGVRTVRRDPWIRRVSGRVANAVRDRFVHDGIVDTGCSLKAFRRECLGTLKLYDGMHRWLPALLRMEGFRVVQLPVHHRPRVWGASKYGIRNRLFRSLADLMAVRWMRKRRLGYEVVRHDP